MNYDYIFMIVWSYYDRRNQCYEFYVDSHELCNEENIQYMIRCFKMIHPEDAYYIQYDLKTGNFNESAEYYEIEAANKYLKKVGLI